MDQNYVKFTSDSLIALALNYYTVERGDSVTRAKAQYYYGRVLRLSLIHISFSRIPLVVV